MMKRILAAVLAALLLLCCVPALAAETPEPVTFTIFVDHTWFFLDRWGSDPVSQKITELTGVSFEVVRADNSNQLAQMIATGDLPDFIYTGTEGLMPLLQDGDVCYSYTDLAAQYGVDIHATAEEIANNVAADGKYYCLLNAHTSQEAIDARTTLLGPGTKSMAYRTDIYEALGSPELNTMDDLENMLLAAKEMYPDVIPLLYEGARPDYIGQQLGLITSNVAYDAQGNPCYVLCQDGYKEYYALLNRYYREGLISMEAATYDYTKFVEIRNSGKSFVQMRASGEALSANKDAVNAGTDYRWRLLDHELSDNARYVDTGIGWSGTFITKNCKNPQRAIEFMAWCRTEEARRLCAWGIEGQDWVYNDKGQTERTTAYNEAIISGKQKQKDLGIGVWLFGDQGDENAFADYGTANPDDLDNIQRLRSAVEHAEVKSELYFCTPREGDELNLFNALNDMVSSEQLKVVYAETEEAFETAYDAMMQKAESMGLSELNAWMKQKLDAYRASVQ